MKKVAFFITHRTLGLIHAVATFFALSQQLIRDDVTKFDALYLYNTHQDELSNTTLINLYKGYGLDNFFNELKVFHYNEAQHKSLGADVSTIGRYMEENYAPEDRVLLLKSDCILSRNYLDEILHLPEDQSVFFTAPFICAKERISDAEIFRYARREKYIPSDDITFNVENQVDDTPVDLGSRQGVEVTDEKIKFTSCYVVTDYSCHYLTVGLFPLVYQNIQYQSWGGVKFYNLRPFLKTTNRCFVVHKYHDIISENRNTDREGPVEKWLKS